MSKVVTPYQDANRTKKEQVEEMFDNIAHNYDFLNHLLSMGIDNIWRRKAIKYLSADQPKVILDVASGTGDFAIEATKISPEKVIALDISEEMMVYGRKKVKAKKLDQIVEFVKGDSENLEYPDNTFDAMTVGFGVRNFENLEQGLSEMLRVLKPGGKLVVLEISQPTGFPMKQIFHLYFNYVCPLIGKTFSKDARAYTYLPESVKVFPEGNRFLDILSGVGYKNATWKPLTMGICAMYTCEK